MKLIQLAECFFYGIQPPWLEKSWRGFCHYEGEATYREHFMMNVHYAWEIINARPR